MAPDDTQAKVSVKLRIWRLFTLQQCKMGESRTKASAFKAGLPVYTGPVKTPGFKALLARWQPVVIIMCVFGQMFDSDIIQAPPCGVFNVHPSHLTAGKGKGPQPLKPVPVVWPAALQHHLLQPVPATAAPLKPTRLARLRQRFAPHAPV